MSREINALGDNPAARMIDPFGRAITYLRVSVTDRCDFRCVYCMAEDMTFLPKRDLLTLEELDRLCTRLHRARASASSGSPAASRWCAATSWRCSSALGRHLRDRRARRADAHHQRLAARALRRASLRDAGVRRINVSLDTLDPAKFKAITRWGDLGKVMAGIEAAQAAGLAIKINAVALKGVNEDEIPEMIALGAWRRAWTSR